MLFCVVSQKLMFQRCLPASRPSLSIFWIAEDILNEPLTSNSGQLCRRRHCSAGNLLNLSTSSHVASNVLFKLRNRSFLKQLWGESKLGRLLDSHSLSVRPPGDVSASDALLSILWGFNDIDIKIYLGFTKIIREHSDNYSLFPKNWSLRTYIYLSTGNLTMLQSTRDHQ